MSYLDYTEQNRKEGIIYQQLSSGKYKDTGDPDKKLTGEERELLMRDVEKMHRIFIEMVAEYRGLAIETVERLADGSTMLGEEALLAGLIDEIGDIEDVKDYLRTQLDIEPFICTFSAYEIVE
jgi:protease-4